MVVVFITIFLMLFSRVMIVYLINKKKGFHTDGDAIGHLNYIKEIYNHQGRIQEKLKKYLLDYNDYPNGFHKIFYMFKIPLRFLEKFGGYLPILFDLCLLLFTILFIHLFGDDNYTWLLAFPFLRLFIANEGRSSHFSERAYGVLWGNIFLGSMVAYYISPDIIWFVISLISFFIFSVSSKFSWQATFFTTLLLSIFEQSFFFISLYLISFATSFLFSKGYSYAVLKGLIRHSIFYKEHLSKKCFGMANHYKNFFSIIGRTSMRQKTMLLMTNSVAKIISDNPLNIAIIFFIITQNEWSVFYSWSLAGMVLLLLISLEPLKFLGEPERYLEYSIIPVFVILSENTLPYFISSIIIIGLVSFYLLQCYLFIKSYRKKNAPTDDMQGLLDFFSSIQNQTILALPLRTSFFLGYFTDTNKFVTLFSNVGKGELRQNYKELIPDFYPYPGKNLGEYISKYAINYIVAEKKRIQLLENHLKEQYYTFDRYTIAYESDSYTVYKV